MSRSSPANGIGDDALMSMLTASFGKNTSSKSRRMSSSMGDWTDLPRRRLQSGICEPAGTAPPCPVNWRGRGAVAWVPEVWTTISRSARESAIVIHSWQYFFLASIVVQGTSKASPQCLSCCRGVASYICCKRDESTEVVAASLRGRGGVLQPFTGSKNSEKERCPKNYIE